MVRQQTSGGFLRLIAKTLKLGDRYVDKEHIRKISIHRSPPTPPALPPILLGLTLHSRCIRVLHFEPIGRAAGTVGGILALRDDAFKTHFASMGEDPRAPSCFRCGRTVSLPRVIQSKTGMAQPRSSAGRVGLFLDPNQIAAWFHPLMFRINIWVVIAILLVLFAVTRYLTHERQPSRVCADDPSAPACQR